MFLALTVITIFTIASCGKTHNDQESSTLATTEVLEIAEKYQTDTQADIQIDTQTDIQTDTQTGTKTDTQANTDKEEKSSETTPAINSSVDSEMKNKFGENCIAEQTFEVQLSEYDEKVYFVPFLPYRDSEEIHMQIIQDGHVLNTLTSYVPTQLQGESFTSLDAVSFFDVNYDSETDIVLIETYGNTSFAVVLLGEINNHDNDKSVDFSLKSALSENISSKLQEPSIPEIRTLLSGGKKNGEFSNYQEAYKALTQLIEFSNDRNEKYTYNLTYVDEDDIPELSARLNGNLYLYTYQDGTLYLLMDDWGFGMGDSGFYYAPKQNSIQLYDTDFAGALLHTIYWKINEEHSIENIVCIDTYYYDDANGNGIPDEEEITLDYSASYIDGVEISDETRLSYEKGKYEPIVGEMTFDELMTAL